MDTFRAPSANSAPSQKRHLSSTWNLHFGNNETRPHIVEREPLPVESGGCKINAFIQAEEGVLSPPSFNWNPLELFLRSAVLKDLTDRRRNPRLSRLCLIDDRSCRTGERYDTLHLPVEPTRQSNDSSTVAEGNLSRNVSAIFRKALDERELYGRLLEDRSTKNADRRVLLIMDLTPLCAAALAITEARCFVATLRVFLNSYITGEIYFFANAYMPHDPGRYGSNSQVPLEHIRPESKFSMGFHLSYIALRDSVACSDFRGIRQSYPMIKPLDKASAELICHEAQISFLTVGVNERYWTAYCCVDTYFKSEQSAEMYISRDQDGPTGGARAASQPCWNPRDYFLLVLSQRISQISREWRNVFTVFMSRLDSYESYYIRTIDTESLCDDSSMSQTRSYTKAASMLRQFHDTLATTIESLQTFLDDNLHFFETDGVLDEKSVPYLEIVHSETFHLRRFRRRLLQRMKRFDGMKDGLVSSSALQESRRSTKQGDDIGVLTNMTVAYLPFNLAAGIFSISSTAPRGFIWLYWVVTSVVLSMATFYFAFGRSIWARWVGTK